MRILLRSALLFCCCLFFSTAGRAQGKLPSGLYRSIAVSSFSYQDPVSGDSLYLDPVAVCTAADFSEVSPDVDEVGRPVIEIVLTEEGKQKFAKATREYIGRKIAVVGHGKLLAAPIVQEEIPGGRLRISGSFTMEEVTALALRLRKDIPGKPSGHPEEVAEVPVLKDAIRQLDEALISKDTTVLRRILHEQLSMGHSNGLIENKEVLLQHLRSGYLKYGNIVADGNATIQQVQHVATVRRNIKVTGALQGTAFDVKLQVLEIWIAADRKWQLLCRQSVRQQ